VIARGGHLVFRLFAVVCALVLVACSSTTEERSGVADSTSADAAVDDRAGSGASGAAGASGRTASDGARAAAGGTGDTATSGDTRPAAAPDAPVAKVPTGGTVKIGVHLSANGAAASAFGVPLPNHSPAKVDAIVKWINAHDGIGGRRVDVVYHTTDPLQGSFDQQAQNACTDLAQDKKVDYAISAAQVYRDLLPACFAKNATPFVWDVYYPTQRNVAPADFLYRPAQPHNDRLAFVVDGLARHGFFRGARLGIVRFDNAKSKSISDSIFKPALKRHGVTVHDEFAMREPESAAQASDSAASASSGVLRFRQNRITHVLFVPSGAEIPLLYLAAAESQGYRPKYGFTSLDAPYFIRDSVPHSQLAGAVGVGWGPAVDLGPERREAQGFSSASKLCVSIATGAGYGADEAPLAYCDMLFFLRAALAKTRGTTAAALADGVTDATGFSSSLTFATKFAPGRHDGPSKARIFTFTDNWNYVGAPFAI
jgi:ABC-type branched-subunit amino acid transport system substrate-binding protein